MAKQYIGTGRRKSAVARVRLIPGTGKITVNKKDLDDYFPMEILKNEVRRPFQISGNEGGCEIHFHGRYFHHFRAHDDQLVGTGNQIRTVYVVVHVIV